MFRRTRAWSTRRCDDRKCRANPSGSYITVVSASLEGVVKAERCRNASITKMKGANLLIQIFLTPPGRLLYNLNKAS